MPTLRPSAQLENIKRSFDVFVSGELGASFPNAINYPGMAFDESQVAEWIEPWVLGPIRLDNGYGREIEPGVIVQLVTYIVQVNIFMRPSRLPEAVRTAHRLYQLRDLVVGAMPLRSVVPVYDYYGDISTIGKLILDRANLDAEVPQPVGVEDLRQWSYAITARWAEEVQL